MVETKRRKKYRLRLALSAVVSLLVVGFVAIVLTARSRAAELISNPRDQRRGFLRPAGLSIRSINRRLGGTLVSHFIKLSKPTDNDEELLSWLAKAYSIQSGGS